FPGAENKTIYVWVEAVLGYISATIEACQQTGQPDKWREYWFNKNSRTLYFIGKDNIPFHTIILPALLLASGEDFNLPWNVSSTEFLQFKGEKASKSRKIGIWIDEALEIFPVDYWRFFLIVSRPETKDSNFSWELFIEKINADLNDTYGNFIHRTLTFINSKFSGQIPTIQTLDDDNQKILDLVKEKVNQIGVKLETAELQSAANLLISLARMGNQYLNDKEPWKLLKTDFQKAATIFYVAAQIVKALAVASIPFMPQTAAKILQTLELSTDISALRWQDATKSLDAEHKIRAPQPLFKKIDCNEIQLEDQLMQIRAKKATKV
ncbi:MAG: class I tRNA ligase family protein, partial [Crenarchaeota archaeon]|nr:class I tRNA ligase family protein [Thermoproteota archaeon]